MARARWPRTALAALGAVGVAACTPGADPTSEASTSTPSGPEQQLTVLSQGPVLGWDPQRMTSRQSAAFASRTYLRTLTAYPPATDLAGQRTLVGDLARSTGRASKDLREWTFTLRDDLTWQDGSPLTCADLRYGVSRSFDKDTGSTGYALTYLDIPKRPDGTSRYPGPYTAKGRTPAARALLEDAVVCRGSSITYRLGEPVADFDAVVSTPEFAPYKRSRDDREDSAYDAFSSGPYQLAEPWQPSSGGTWVRNPRWSAASDPLRSPTVRTIVHREDVSPTDAVTTMSTGPDGSRAVLADPLPEALHAPVADAEGTLQAVSTDAQIVEYLAPNHRSAVLRRTAVRRALAAATDREGYLAALGGATAGSPAWSLLGTALDSAHEPVLDHGPTGDPAAARRLLAAAEVRAPRLQVAYRPGGQVDAAMGALEAGWEEAGFEITLVPVRDDYYDTVAEAAAAKRYDVFWGSWGPDYPSAATVLPLLFDDRINITPSSSGRDYGYVEDDRTNRAMDEAMTIRDDEDRARAWAEVDSRLLSAGSYIPLVQRRSTFLAGRDVTGLSGNAVYGGALELGTLGVSR